ncbi:MAG: ABC transporter ATP-binding protein [Ruminococcus sp.]|nr:ABC transporter ATP-binding protein [Ruminococcus sp.]
MIETINLVKEYNNHKAVNNASVRIEDGNIYGFIGKNGAGKTTFIRMIAGLIFPTSGEIIINGKSDYSSLAEQRKNMSFIVETPYYEPSLTAYENMELQRLIRGISSENNPSRKWLEFVGLGDTGKKKACNFSLGMRQRLGIAMAMISEPDVLFLDEPVNGLDPVGIIQMRELIKNMNREFGTTIVISSHILSELYQVATKYIFIDKGCIIGQFSKEQLDENCKSYIEIEISDVEKSVNILQNKSGCHEIWTDRDKKLIRIYDDSVDTSEVAYHLICNGVSLYRLNKTGMTLEEFFISQVNG